MDKKQVVTINTMHTCPMTTGNTPHVGGPIIGPGCSTATLNGIPIALQGDKCICAAGGQDVILQGCPTATINGVPIALQGSPTAHGGTIPAGVPGAVIISKNTSVLEAVAEGEPAVYNLQWVKEEQIIRNSKIEKVVTLVADARNIPNGEEVTVKVHTPEQDGGSSMLTELKGIVQDNQVQVEWKVEQKEEPTEPSTNCIVKFSLNENYSNLFGFDSYEMSQKGSNDPENLKKAYRSIDSLSEEYLIPWVRIGKYKYGKLVVTVEGNFTKITFNDPKSYFTFEPDTLTSKDQEVKITCNNIIKEEEYKVEVLSDGKLAGGLMFLENSVKKLVIQPIYVTQNSDDGKNIDTFANNILLKQYFDKSFAPLLIQYTLESPFELNLDDPKWNQIPFQRNKVEKIKKTIGKGKRIIVKTSQENTSNDKRISLITDIAHLYQSTKGYEENPPYPLFFTYWECQKEDDIGNFIGSNNGITSSPSKYASMLFLANRDKIPSFDIPHEVLHGLGLEHTFDSKSTYTFIQGATQNYMDYKAQQMDIKDFAKEKHYTFKWQWDLVRISRWIEEQKIFLPIILLLLLLVSCKTYKNVSCEFDYFPTKDEMVLDSITYPLNQNISIGHKTYRNFKSSFNKNINYLAIDIDTLDVILTKYIDFNNGKIKLTNFTISKSRNIGKEYHFDENGNVTKVIDNDEGFAICWQQALFIAKKYAGKDAFEWMIGKDFYKKRNAWEIYYRKNKTPYFLVIDAQTGEIVRKGLRGGYVNDYIK